MEQHILHINELDSTNEYVKSAYRSGEAREQFSVYTDFQKAGKGQRGNHWDSVRGKNLLASFLVDQKLNLSDIPKLNLASVLAVISSLDDYAISDVFIKWPNDIIVRDKKVAGILVENSLEGDKTKFSVVGIGLNVNQTHFDLPFASSMKNLTGLHYNIEEVVRSIYIYLYNYINLPLGYLLKQVNQRLYMRNQWVTFTTQGQESSFKVLSFSEDGGLNVKSEETEMKLQHHNSKWHL